jgi:ABC-type dipeptide/oligopeptide/nickel transport system permease component
MIGEQASDEQVDIIRASMGLDRPLPEQFMRFLVQLVQGNLGTSIRASRPVGELVKLALPATLELAGVTILIALVVGIPVGIVAGLKPGRLFDNLSLLLALLGQSVPSFWLGLNFIVLFALRLRILPTSGRGEWKQLILPACALAPRLIGIIVRMTRSSFEEVLREDYIRTAHAKGLRDRSVILRHAFKNAMIPVITVIGLQIGGLLEGAVVTEVVFAWPGVGQLAVNALRGRDYPVVQGVVLMSAFVFVAINLIVDFLYSVFDPRVRYD